jgi:hypothetical protein
MVAPDSWTSERAQQVVHPLIAAIGEISSPRDIGEYATVVQTLAPYLAPNHAGNAAATVMSAAAWSSDIEVYPDLAAALIALLQRLPPEEQVRSLVDVMKYPSTAEQREGKPGTTGLLFGRLQSLANAEPRTAPQTVLESLARKYGINLATPPSCPAPLKNWLGRSCLSPERPRN